MGAQVQGVTLSARGAGRARAGHPWIFRADVESAPPGLPSGAEVRLADARGNFIARAFWAERSPIALRILSRRDEPLDEGFLRARVETAVARRRWLFPQADAFRAVHGEADLLPGYFVDRYGDLLAVQHLAEWAEVRRDVLARMAAEACGARGVVARDDGSSRDFELLPRRTEVLLGSGPMTASYHEGELLLQVDLLEDHKTGGYLDQRENHLRAGELARGEALDAFCYHGGFALQLARCATRVLAIDQDAAAVARTRENAARNGLTNVEVRAANAVEQLRALDKDGRKFDVVVLDPPAFAKRREGVAGALRAYKEINYRGVRLLAAGGVLITCSCSGKVTPQMFGEVIEWASQEAKRPLQLLERRGAARDHPSLVGVPETDYLKCWVLLAP
ncbi:MAG: class I SAM-dependent rRNA methyltransferase [Deltaproteobacteria bacterium]|nr:MAG: class I SAM-dependent rRNA methyltransferase [Deltaproteobacteria bacterium]